ncbi:MAG: hypothetical protein IJS21_03770, partial [Deltaproteobacteria bacterium]|nr:hypothetical protein [Deltaproteobacteria bacterium]
MYDDMEAAAASKSGARGSGGAPGGSEIKTVTLDKNVFSALIEDALTALQNRLRSGNSIFFENQEVWIPAQNRELLADDPLRARLNVHSGSAAWKKHARREQTRGMEKRPASLAWRLPEPEEAKDLIQSLTKDQTQRLKFPAGTAVSQQGITYVPASADRPANYMRISALWSTPSFGSTNDSVMDIEVASIREPLDLFVVRNRLMPDKLKLEHRRLLDALFRLLDSGYLEIRAEDQLTLAVTKKLQNLTGERLEAALAGMERALQVQVVAPAAPQANRADNAGKEGMSPIDAILKADFTRAEITAYSELELRNPNGGLWELWELLRMDTGKKVHLEQDVYARNPVMDVDWQAIVGIDFGTKNTVVSRMSENGVINLVRVGSGAYHTDASNPYENPTLIRFSNLERFRNDFNSSDGRPRTRWADVSVSHAAVGIRDDLFTRKGPRYTPAFGPRYTPAFFGDLKQWAGGLRKSNVIQDEKTIDAAQSDFVRLPPFLDLKEADSDLDPIAWYAYYIGLYINNMYTGQPGKRICLNYRLSFPVNYSNNVREQILDSFRRGLKKSLPQSVLDDEECSKAFRVEEGSAEPAAYAVTALRSFG